MKTAKHRICGWVGALMVTCLASPGHCAEPERIPLWAEGVPGGITNGGSEKVQNEQEGFLINVHEPALIHIAPKNPNGTAVIVCPGGAYSFLSMRKEGDAIAGWLAPQGIHVFILKYRLKEYQYPAQLRDVLCAIRLVRSRSADWGIEPGRIGVMGFSAGGHLASMAAALYDRPEGRTGAALDSVSGRPDFAALIYPVISMEAPFTHQASRRNLLGANPSADHARSVSTHLQVTSNTPPTFLIHAGNDKTVAVEHSLLFYQALRKAGVNGELHVFENGGHGFGIKPGYGTTSDWTKRFEEWLHGLKCLSPEGARSQQQTEFVPGTLWRDQSGNPINAHGGGVMFFEGVYYWYGEHKLPGRPDSHSGDYADGGVHAYSSTDLLNWKEEGVVLPVQQETPSRDLAYGCIFERPKVLFNERTRTFVMFFKYYPVGTAYNTGYVGVATASAPTGPFTFRHKFLGADSPKGSGDFAIFQDADGAVYHLAVRKPDRAFCIGKLRDDYLFPAGPYQVVAGIPSETEAPALMRKDGKYYLIGSGSTGWKPNTARAFVADAVTGPYTSIENPCVGVNPHNGLGPDKTFGGQISFLLPVAGKPGAFIAMFDVWKPERPSEGLYVWLPVKFSEGRPVIEWRDQWVLSAFD